MQFLSNILAEARGSLNGTVFSRNRAGAYTRGRTKPINPNSPAQSAVRAAFATIAAGWSNLTNTEVINWNEYAATQTRFNKLGQPYTPSGRQVFTQLSNNSIVVNGGILTDPPPPGPLPAYSEAGFTFAVAADAGLLDSAVFTLATTLGAGDVVVIQASAPKVAGHQSTSVPYKQLTITTATIPAMASTYAAVYGSALNAGQVIHFRLRVINETTGLASDWIYYNTLVSAAP